jgi:hypothetical protein
LEGLAIEEVGIFYRHLVYFTPHWNILWPFGIFCGKLVYIYLFWYIAPKKSGNPAAQRQRTNNPLNKK